MPGKLIDAGIDYIRITSPGRRRAGKMMGYFQRVVRNDQKLGYDVVRGGAFGFWGDKIRHALYAEKEEWSMLQVSGYEAKRALELAYEGTQATRIDIQATWQLEGQTASECLREAYEHACEQQNPGHRPRMVKLIEERHACQTVYIGSRASDIFIRIYDKFAESGKEEFKNSVRFEAEIKGRASKALWERIKQDNLNVRDLLSMLLGLLAERGVAVPEPDFDIQDMLLVQQRTTEPSRKLAWLASAVAPTVAALTATHGWSLLFSVLFDNACTEFDKRAIIRALSTCWGS
jgi:Replication initiation factor